MEILSLLPIIAALLMVGLAVYQGWLLIYRINLIKRWSKIIVDMYINGCKREDFFQQLYVMRRTFSDWAILQLAHRKNWPAAVVTCLPKLYFKISGDKDRIIIWKEALKLIPQNYSYTIVGKICNGEVVYIQASHEAANWIDQMIVHVEAARQHSPYTSKKAIAGILNQVMMDIEGLMQTSNEGSKASMLHEERKLLLENDLKLRVG